MADVKEILDEEELSFAKTLDRGEKLFEGYRAKAEEIKSDTISGADAWRLYDTYGFPVDLTRIMAEEKGLKLDEQGFVEEQDKAKDVSRARKGGAGERTVALDVHALGELEKNAAVPKTDDSAKYGEESWFDDRLGLRTLTAPNLIQVPRTSKPLSRPSTWMASLSTLSRPAATPFLASSWTRPTFMPSREAKRSMSVSSRSMAKWTLWWKMSRCLLATYFTSDTSSTVPWRSEMPSRPLTMRWVGESVKLFDERSNVTLRHPVASMAYPQQPHLDTYPQFRAP